MPGKKKSLVLIAAEERIVKLEEELKQGKELKDYYYKQYAETNEQLEGLHIVLDEMEIKGFSDEYKSRRIPLTVRLFAWALKQNAHI